MVDVNIFVAFTSGLASFFAPCVIPLIPAYLGYISGVSVIELKKDGLDHYRKEVWLSSLFFVFGFSVIFVLLGAAAATFGSFFRQQAEVIQIFGGLLVMVFALHFMGVLKLPIFSGGSSIKLPKWVDHFKLMRAFLIGVIFATVWTPCVGAVLGAILTLAAASQTVWVGAILLLVYSLGISIPFLLMSSILSKAPELLKSFQKKAVLISKVTGGLLFVIGFLLFNNSLQLMSEYLTYDALNQWMFTIAYKLGYGV